MKQYKKQIILGAAVLAVLALVFWWGGNAPGLRGWNLQPDSVSMQPTASPAVSVEPSNNAVPSSETVEPSETKESAKPDTAGSRPGENAEGPLTAAEKESMAAHMLEGASLAEQREDTGDAERKKETSVSEERPAPIEPRDAVITDREFTCTLSVRCDTILQNMAWLKPEKVELVPRDGVIFAERTVTFYEGESVFHLLLREMKKHKIHMEYSNTPVYRSAYIEGIHNLYEFDCGELSGWMYKVNGWFPNYGCLRYQLKQGDRVEWVYTCDLGIDVGGYYAASGE